MYREIPILSIFVTSEIRMGMDRFEKIVPLAESDLNWIQTAEALPDTKDVKETYLKRIWSLLTKS